MASSSFVGTTVTWVRVPSGEITRADLDEALLRFASTAMPSPSRPSATAGRMMRDRGAGTIINVSSTAGFVTIGHYSAIKAYVTTLTEALHSELAGSGVAATALCPGWVRTEFHERASIRTGSIPDWMWLDADQLVAECLRDVAAGKAVSIPSFRYKVMMSGARYAPRNAVRALSRRLASRRH